MDRPSTSVTALSAFWPALLVLLVLVLLPVAHSAEVALGIGAICGLVLAWRNRATLRTDRGIRLVTILFGCYWLAAFLSAPAAINSEKSWGTVAVLLRFFPFALFACFALRDATCWRRVVDAIAMLLVLWLLDAWVQIFTGYSLAGPTDLERLSGIFGASNLKLGPVLAVLSPFVFVAARERFGWRGLVIAFVFQLMPILLAGSRAGWLMYALITLIFVWRETRAPLRFITWCVGAVCLVALAGIVLWHGSGAFDARVQRSLLALKGSEQAVDEAAAGRLRIWGTAERMIAAHPITGVGVRGFRYAYSGFALAGDNFVDPKTEEGAAHAHQIVLEVVSETGIVGLTFWMLASFAAIRAWFRANASARERGLAPGLALAAMCFPLNTHLAFYSAWWGLLFWWLLALYCAALGSETNDAT